MEENGIVVNVDGPDILNSLKVDLSKPYFWEGYTYTAVDLSGLERMSTRALKKIMRRSIAAGQAVLLPELDMEYCMNVAAEASGLPIEFFDDLPAADGTRVKNRVMSFLLAGA